MSVQNMQFSWSTRWRYPGEEKDLPTLEPKVTPLPRSMDGSIPRPYRPSEPTPRASEYTSTFAQTAALSLSRSLSGSQSQKLVQTRHHLDPFFHLSAEEKAKLSDSERSFLLWGRVNPGWSTTGMWETETRRAFKEPVGAEQYGNATKHAIKVRDKAFVEAVAIQGHIAKLQNMAKRAQSS